MNEPVPPVDRYRDAIQGIRLLPITHLLGPISTVLGVSPEKSFNFIHIHILTWDIKVYCDDEVTGLWCPVSESVRASFLGDILGSEGLEGGNSDALDEWDFIRILPSDSRRLVEWAEGVASTNPAGSIPPDGQKYQPSISLEEEESLRSILREHLKNQPEEIMRQLCCAALGIETTPNSFKQYFDTLASAGLKNTWVDLATMCSRYLLISSSNENFGDFISVREHCARNFVVDFQFLYLREFDRIDTDNIIHELFHSSADQLESDIFDFCMLVQDGVRLYRKQEESFVEVSESDPLLHFVRLSGQYGHGSGGHSFPEWADGLYVRHSDIELHGKFFAEPVDDPLQNQVLRAALRQAIGASPTNTGLLQSSLSNPSRLESLCNEVKKRYYSENFSLNDEDTWPKQTTIVEWLTSERSLSKREAEAVDLVTRPDRLRGK